MVQSARTALKLAQDQLRRQKELWTQGITTKEQLDKAENEVKLREIDLQERERQVATLQPPVQEQRATLDGARYDLSKARIESPIDGLVTRRNIEEGETVVIGTMNNAGTVLLTIADMSIIEAEVEVDETDIPTVNIGQPAVVTIDSLPNRKFKGRVTEVGNSPIQTAAAGGSGPAGDELQGRRHGGGRDSGSPARLHVHGRDHDGDARRRAVSTHPGPGRARAGLRSEGRDRPAAEAAAAAARDGLPTAQAQELPERPHTAGRRRRVRRAERQRRFSCR